MPLKGHLGANVDYAQLIKAFRSNGVTRETYGPGDIVELVPITIMGKPNKRSISTSYIERQNLTMQMRRFTRLTNAFSKKLDNLKAALALHFAWYNFGWIHQSLKVTPAVEACITDHIWEWDEILDWTKNRGQVILTKTANSSANQCRIRWDGILMLA